MPAVREAVVDGLFYPALRAQVVDYLAGVGAADDIGRTPKPKAGILECVVTGQRLKIAAWRG